MKQLRAKRLPVWIACLAVGILGCGDPASDGAAARPNLLLIVADDLGYADLGVYGSEIETPNLDRLAREGVQLTNFHVAATCSPTRAMLLSGVDNHRNCLGSMDTFMAANQRGRPGYEGYLNLRVAAASELLRDAGYDAYFVGKWHLGTAPGNWPADRGFSRSYALLEGSADNFSATGPAPVLPRVTFVEDDRAVEREAGHSSQLFVDKLLAYLDADRDGGRPFFGVLSFQAVHWPHQAPRAYVEKYVETYARGWETLRAERFAKQQALDLVPRGLALPPPSGRVPAWSELGADERRLEAWRMAAYAGMTEHMDVQIGRVIERLRELGVYENTAIFFVSDNGPRRVRAGPSASGARLVRAALPGRDARGDGRAGIVPDLRPTVGPARHDLPAGFQGLGLGGRLARPADRQLPGGLGGRSGERGLRLRDRPGAHPAGDRGGRASGKPLPGPRRASPRRAQPDAGAARRVRHPPPPGRASPLPADEEQRAVPGRPQAGPQRPPRRQPGLGALRPEPGPRGAKRSFPGATGAPGRTACALRRVRARTTASSRRPTTTTSSRN